jgi:thioredoxin reductase (NADPH)
MKNIVIVGHGPAGISTAIYLKRAGYHPIVIGKGYGSFSYDDIQIENYYGFANPINGKDLVDQGIAQAKRLGIDMIYDAVLDLVDLGDGFEVKTEKRSFEASAVLLATGKRRLTLCIPGFQKYRGKGISFCATCDGFFYRKKKLAIIGSGPYMQQELKVLENLSSDITVFTHGKALKGKVDHVVNTSKILAFEGDTKISSIKTSEGSFPVDGVFVAIGTPSSLDFAEKLGVIVENNNLFVDKSYQTNVEGLFAAGDVIGGKLQIAKAVYDGMMVADSIQKYLKNKSVK